MGFEAGQVVGGKYRLFKELARGGMGAIWVARHTELDVSVAIKLIASDVVLSETSVSRFRQEARAAAQLRSPHVVQIMDYGVEQGVPYMAMELLTGEDLDQVLQSQGRLPLRRVIDVCAPVARALKLAHTARIVHRDLKPANIFLARVGDEEVVKVLDFGIAKALSPDANVSHTNSTTLVGSPLYMSPEQSRGEPVDHRTDLWSLAVVMFECLVGTVPFAGRGLGDIFAQICHNPTPVPSAFGLQIEGLDEFFKKALAKDREDRFFSATDMVAALEACHVAAPLTRKVSPEAETVALRMAGETAIAKSVHGRTQGGVSAEVRLAEALPASPSRPRWPVFLGVSVVALVGLGVLGWKVGLLSPQARVEVRDVDAVEDANPNPAASRDIQVDPVVSATSPPASLPSAMASAAPSAPPSGALATGKRPPPPKGTGPQPSAAPPKTATPDPIFGISGKP